MNMSSITIQDIPTEALFPYLLRCFSTTIKWYRTGPTKSPYCSEKYKNYLVLLSMCRRVCKEWREYFSDLEFWKPVFRYVKINHFYDKKLNLLITEKKKKLKSSDWCQKEINDNQCIMIVKNKTKIPFDIYCGYRGGTMMKKLMGLENMSYETYPNERWVCLPTKEWLQENPYSTIGFSWIIDVFKLEECQYRDSIVSTKLAYVVRIKEPDYSKMLPIKDLNKEFSNYPKKIISLLFNKKEVEDKWTRERDKRKLQNEQKQDLVRQIRKLKKEISESQEKSNNYLFLMNQMD